MDLLSAWAVFETFLTDAVSSPWMLITLFLVCLIDGFFPPVPSEVVLLTATAVTWSTNPQATVLVVLTAIVGAWFGDNCAYWIGRRAGLAPLPWMRGPRYSAAADRVRRELLRRPESVLLTGRFIPVARVVINMVAGASRLPYRRFLLLSLASASVWVCASMLIVVLVGAVVPLSPLMTTVVTVTVALVTGLIVDRAVAARRDAASRMEQRAELQ